MTKISPELESLIERMPETSEELYAWRAAMRRHMDARYQDDAYADWSDEEILADAQAAIGEAPMWRGIAFYDDVCDYFLRTDDDGRAALRSAFSLDIVLLNFSHTYIFEVKKRLVRSGEAHELRRGLAAASIEENRVDVNTMVVLLNDLIDEGRQAGLDVNPIIEEVAAMSSPQPSGRSYGYSMQAFIKSYAR